MKTKILSNGSKWMGQKPDSMEELIEVLKNHDLDLRSWGAFGFVTFASQRNPQNWESSKVYINGNFRTISHVFRIEGTYFILRPLIKAIEENIARQCDRTDRTDRTDGEKITTGERLAKVLKLRKAKGYNDRYNLGEGYNTKTVLGVYETVNRIIEQKGLDNEKHN